MMLRIAGLGWLLLVVVATHRARGFSSVTVVHQQQGLRSRLRSAVARRPSSGEWSPARAVSGQDLWTTATFDENDDDDAEAASKREYDTDLFVAAAIPPILAYILYDEIAHAVAVFFDIMGFPGSNVDGNAFATNLLRPTINGVVGECSTVHDE